MKAIAIFLLFIGTILIVQGYYSKKDNLIIHYGSDYLLIYKGKVFNKILNSVASNSAPPGKLVISTSNRLGRAPPPFSAVLKSWIECAIF